MARHFDEMIEDARTTRDAVRYPRIFMSARFLALPPNYDRREESASCGSSLSSNIDKAS
jgi:hypothetical protein